MGPISNAKTIIKISLSRLTEEPAEEISASNQKNGNNS
jgi:hypothetical protein